MRLGVAVGDRIRSQAPRRKPSWALRRSGLWSLRQGSATRGIDVNDEVSSDRAGFWRPHPSPDWGRDWVMAGPVLVRTPDASSPKATEVPCETEAFVI
jgi:hypothetical protein